MSDYLMEHGQRETAQTDQADPRQHQNEAGGYVFDVGIWAQLRRWLILGSEGGDYYAGEKQRTVENVKVLDHCLAENGARTVALIVEVSTGGLAPSNEQALFALARAIAAGDKATRFAAGQALPQVARTGTHLFSFAKYAQTQRGWGVNLRKAVAGWYESKAPDKLAYQLVKYRQREGVTHRDLLRLSHPKPPTPGHARLYGFASGNTAHEARADDSKGRPTRAAYPWTPSGMDEAVVVGFIAAQATENPAETAKLIREYRLPREAVKPEHLNDQDVWRALLDVGMPLGAMTRNLATMTRNGVLTGEYLATVTDAITNPEIVQASRLHPMALLVAMRTYASGTSFRGRGDGWNPIPDVVDALDEAFYLAFNNVVPTGKRTLLAIDVSGSMQYEGISGMPIRATEAACAMALVTLHAEKDVTVVGFDTSVHVNLGLSRRQRLDDAVARMPGGGGTDCSLPYRYAMQHHNGIPYDAVILYTDNETWAGGVHPHQLAEQWRNTGAPYGRSVFVAMTATRHSLAKPEDQLSMNVVGFDTTAPSMISAFVSGQL